MLHPDEGMIHTWLDGQLPAGEGAAIDAHVATCPECAAKVAEERGFAAGATRILTALDNVPGDVIPIRPRANRFSPRVLQAAAMLLVVATGGLIAVRVSGNGVEIPTREKAAAAAHAQVDATSPAPVTAAAETVKPIEQATVKRVGPATVQRAVPVSSPAVPVAAASTISPATKAVPSITRRAVAPSLQLPPVTGAQTTIAQADKSVALATATGAIASAVLSPAPSPVVEKSRGTDTTRGSILNRDHVELQAAVITGVASVAPAKLRVVRSEMIDGGRRVYLRTESGRIAELTETATTVLGPRADGVRTITWKDEGTGKFYELSGKFSEVELRRLRARIEEDLMRKKF